MVVNSGMESEGDLMNLESGLELGRRDIESLPRTAVMTARVDIRALATVVRFMMERGLVCRTKSEAVRYAIVVFAWMLHNGGKVEHFRKTDEALNYLNNLGLKFGEVGRRGNRSLSEQLQKEALEGDFDALYPERESLKESEEYKKAVEILEKVAIDESKPAE